MLKQTFTSACIVAVALASRPNLKTALAQSAATRSTSTQMRLNHSFSQISASTGKKCNHEKITVEEGQESHSDPTSEIIAQAQGQNSRRQNGGQNRRNNGTTLSQVSSSAQQDPDVCQISQNRNKAELPDFYTLLASNQVYEDTEFGHSSDALYWAAANEDRYRMAINVEPSITWQRAAEIEGQHTLFGTDGVVSPNDIDQGWLGNCWFLAAASAMADVPGRLENTFLNNDNELNAAGIYGVNLYTLGVPHTVIVDDWLPLEQMWDGTYKTIFTHVGDDSSLWGPILEKAFAKYHGNYEHIEGGDPRRAGRTLHGGPFEAFANRDLKNYSGQVYKYATAQAEVWEQLQAHTGSKDIITCGTPGTSDEDRNEDNLVQSHAYVVLDILTLDDGTDLVKMRNPHGKDSFTGDFSDTSGDWTQALQDQIGYTPDTADGIIWMTFDDYYAQVEETYINYDVTNWHEAHFLKLDDNTVNPGEWRWCGSDCTRHELTLTSSVDQTVYVSGHTWDRRCVADFCETLTKSHGVYTPGDDYVRTFQYGAADSKPIEMTAGQSLTIETEWDFTNANLPKDWSVVAWAPKGELTLTHNDSSMTTDKLPYIPDNNQSSEPEEETPAEEETPEEETPDEDEGTDHTMSTEQKQFNQWVRSKTPEWDGDGCGVGMFEEPYFDDVNGGYGYQTSFMYTCDYDFLYADVKIAMTHEDWESVTHTFNVVDEETGAVKFDSMESGCEPDIDEPELTVCTFSLRKYDDPESVGVQYQWQRRGGIRTPANVYGMRWYYTDYQFDW